MNFATAKQIFAQITNGEVSQTNVTIGNICRDLGWYEGSENAKSCPVEISGQDPECPEVWGMVEDSPSFVWVSGFEAFGGEDGFIEFVEYITANNRM